MCAELDSGLELWQEETRGFSFLQFMQFLPMWISPISRHFLLHGMVLSIIRQQDEHLLNVPAYLLNFMCSASINHPLFSVFCSICSAVLMLCFKCFSFILSFHCLLKVLQFLFDTSVGAILFGIHILACFAATDVDCK